MTAPLLLPADDLARLADATALMIVLGVLALAQIVLFIAALISIIASPRYTGGGKFLGVVLVFTFPLVGPLAWFVVGRRARIRTELP
jgi:hypothetical protein